MRSFKVVAISSMNTDQMKCFRWSTLILVTLLVISSASSETIEEQMEKLQEIRMIPVYSSLEESSPISRKQLHDMEQNLPTDLAYFESISLSFDQQRDFLQENKGCGTTAAKRFDEFLELEQEYFAIDVFKWCALATSDEEATAYLESTSPALMRLQELVHDGSRSMVILGDGKLFPSTMHGSFVLLRKEHRFIAQEMLRTIVETNLDSLQASPLLIPRTLYNLVVTHVQKLDMSKRDDQTTFSLTPGDYLGSWRILEQKCLMDPLRRMEKPSSWTDTSSHRLVHRCPENNRFCCSIHNAKAGQVVLLGRHPILPVQRLPKDLPLPYNSAIGHFEEEEIPYISTIREEKIERPADFGETPNFYDMLRAQDCLPQDETCSKCLREKKGATCSGTCAKQCPCFCKALCHQKVETKFVAKKLYVTPPRYARDSNRLVPRIVHQTWFEELTATKYPNMSRLVESFKTSTWEYKFYSDEAAASFLSTHFPSEIREAYDELRPGAFKADLFRYCVLLIHGGVYADVDIQLESTLDFAVPEDVGLMVPVDEVRVHTRFWCHPCRSHGLLIAWL
jgi:hypothetical protein